MPFLARKRARIIPALLLLLASGLTASAQETAQPRPKLPWSSAAVARAASPTSESSSGSKSTASGRHRHGHSMGGLIAGMYATGMTPAEAHHFITAVDWDKSLRPEPNYDQLAFAGKKTAVPISSASHWA